MDWLDALETVVGAVIVLAVVGVYIYRYGSRAGAWFTELPTQDRRLFWTAIGLVCWTALAGIVSWAVSFLTYIRYAAGQPSTLEGWAGAASLSLLLASVGVIILAGPPWLVLVLIVRVLRWRGWRSADGTGL